MSSNWRTFLLVVLPVANFKFKHTSGNYYYLQVMIKQDQDSTKNTTLGRLLLHMHDYYQYHTTNFVLKKRFKKNHPGITTGQQEQ